MNHASPRSGRRRSDRGAAATELVIAVPALLLMMLTVVQFAVYAHARHVAQAVAAQALAAARVDGGTAAAGETAGRQLLSQLGSALTQPTVTVRRGPARVAVTVTGSAAHVLPGLVLPVTAQDDGPVERLVPATADPATGG